MPSKQLKSKIKEIAEERKKICEACEYHSSNTKSMARIVPHCTLCKCPISAKTACLSCSCALAEAEDYGIKNKGPKWVAVLDSEEEFTIDSSLDFDNFPNEINGIDDNDKAE